MNLTANPSEFLIQLDAFRPETDKPSRALAMYSAAVALADDDAMTRAIGVGQQYGLLHEKFYEIVLQSYLFLGFPRMLNAAENLDRTMPVEYNREGLRQISPSESSQWYENGLSLCRKVYGEKYDSLFGKVAAMAPEVFRWMIIEGYGKVLSRPSLDIVSRELSIIAFLMMENRKKQLHSHIMGALNVGASTELVNSVIEDIGTAAGDGLESSRLIIDRLSG